MTIPPLTPSAGYPSRVFRAGPRAVMGHCGNAMFTLSEGPSAKGAQAAYDLASELLTLYPEGIANVTIVGGYGGLPDEETRNRIAATVSAFHQRVLCAAMVFEGDGAFSTGMRLFARTMGLVMQSRFPRKVFSDVTEATQWVDGRIQNDLFDAPALQKLIARARCIPGSEILVGVSP